MRPVWTSSSRPIFNSALGTNPSSLEAAFNWMSKNGDNKAPTPGANVSVSDGDNVYLPSLGSKPYIAPPTPWVFNHFSAELSYSEN
jgi:hypothetical protein